MAPPMPFADLEDTPTFRLKVCTLVWTHRICQGSAFAQGGLATKQPEKALSPTVCDREPKHNKHSLDPASVESLVSVSPARQSAPVPVTWQATPRATPYIQGHADLLITNTAQCPNDGAASCTRGTLLSPHHRLEDPHYPVSPATQQCIRYLVACTPHHHLLASPTPRCRSWMAAAGSCASV